MPNRLRPYTVSISLKVSIYTHTTPSPPISITISITIAIAISPYRHIAITITIVISITIITTTQHPPCRCRLKAMTGRRLARNRLPEDARRDMYCSACPYTGSSRQQALCTDPQVQWCVLYRNSMTKRVEIPLDIVVAFKAVNKVDIFIRCIATTGIFYENDLTQTCIAMDLPRPASLSSADVICWHSACQNTLIRHMSILKCLQARIETYNLIANIVPSHISSSLLHFIMEWKGIHHFGWSQYDVIELCRRRRQHITESSIRALDSEALLITRSNSGSVSLEKSSLI